MRSPERRGLVRCCGVLAGVLCGCSTLRVEIGSPIDHLRIYGLMPGITRRAEVMAELGTPQALARHEDGVAMFYEHVRLTEQQFGISLGKAFSWVDIDAGTLFKAITSSSGALHEAALLLFDGRGVLLAYGTASWPEIVGRGGGVQFFTSVRSVVDSSAYLAPPLGMDWGMDWLEPLPQLQNLRYRAGVELRGAPLKSGQRTLELVPLR